MYLLDTNVVSAARRPGRAPKVAAWLQGKEERDLFISAITLGEIERGICQQQRRNPDFALELRFWLDRTVLVFADRILDFGAEDARIWGRLSQEIEHSGADLMIAATALRHGAVVVTGNEKNFQPTGVLLENPFS